MNYFKIFFIKGIPAGKPRPRSARIGNHLRIYQPDDAKGWAKLVALQARRYAPDDPLTGPVAVNLTFVFPRPRAHFTKKGLRPDAPHYHTAKPDRDNLDKLILDVFTRLGFWRDDAQVVRGTVLKLYTSFNYPHPGCWVDVASLEGNLLPK